MTVLLVALGAAVGAPTRYLVDRAVQRRRRSTFPLGTLTVNLVASLILGVVVGAGSRLAPGLSGLVGTGFCGALSTYSTFGYETQRLSEQGRRWLAAGNVAVSVVAGVAAAALGVAIGAALT